MGQVLPTKNAPRRGGNPRKGGPLTEEKAVRRMASIGCTQTEIAEVLGISQHYVSRKYGAAYSRGRSRMCRSLRRKQVELALGGNVGMLVWLGKQYLGQSDKQQIEQTGESKLRIVEEIVTINPPSAN